MQTTQKKKSGETSPKVKIEKYFNLAKQFGSKGEQNFNKGKQHRCQAVLRTGRQCDQITLYLDGESLTYCKKHIHLSPENQKKYLDRVSDEVVINKPVIVLNGIKKNISARQMYFKEKVKKKLEVDDEFLDNAIENETNLLPEILVGEARLNDYLKKSSPTDFKKSLKFFSDLLSTIGRLKESQEKILSKRQIPIVDVQVLLLSTLKLVKKHFSTIVPDEIFKPAIEALYQDFQSLIFDYNQKRYTKEHEI